MLIYLLVFSFFIFLFLTYILMDKDITAPAFVYVLGYFISTLVTAFNVSYWNVQLHWETFFVMLYGTAMFCIPSFLIQQYYKKRYSCILSTTIATPLEYNKLFLRVFCLFQLAVILIWLWYLRQFFINIGQIENISKAMEEFRRWSSYSTAANNDSLYMFLNRLLGNVIISAYVLSTASVYNYVVTGSLKKEILPIVSVLFTIILMLLQGGRGGVVWLAFNVVMLYFLFNYKIKKKKQKINIYFLSKMCMCLFIGSILFYFLKTVVGRGNVDLSFSTIGHYLSFYIGGQTQLMDMYIVKPLEQSALWGKETFNILNGELIKLGLLDADPYIWHLEFRYAENGTLLGNSYPSFRSYLYDFGYLGLTVLPVVFSFVINTLYYHYYYKNSYEISLSLLFYVSIFYSIFFDFSRSIFFSSFVSLLSIRLIFMLSIYYLIFIKNKHIVF